MLLGAVLLFALSLFACSEALQGESDPATEEREKNAQEPGPSAAGSEDGDPDTQTASTTPEPNLMRRPVLSTDTSAALPGLRHAIEALAVDGEFATTQLHAPLLVALFYERRAFAPLWSSERELRESLVARIRDAASDGLEPEDYHLSKLAIGEEETGNSIELELLATDAALLLASHLLQGKVDPSTMHPSWTIARRRDDIALAFEEAIKKKDLELFWSRMTPKQPTYRRLREKLASLRAAADGTETEQKTSQDQINKLLVNLERWRWLPDHLGTRHVRVNIAGFWLEARTGSEVKQRHRVVVGKDARQTPVFSDAIRYFVLNPRWTVPRKIASEDLLKELRKDPKFLEKKKIRVYAADGRQEVSTADVSWKKLSTKNFPYVLRQEPGVNNALGRVKFMFPNAHDVYLHDTPKKEFFEQEVRAFSSGCVRVDEPIRLAEFLVEESSEWNPARIADALAKKAEKIVMLKHPVSVHLLYLTAWADEAGDVVFHDDVYSRDPQLLSALGKP